MDRKRFFVLFLIIIFIVKLRADEDRGKAQNRKKVVTKKPKIKVQRTKVEDDEFVSWKSKKVRKYKNKLDEDNAADNYVRAKRKVEAFNQRKNESFKMDLTEYADVDPDEFLAARAGVAIPSEISKLFNLEPRQNKYFKDSPTIPMMAAKVSIDSTTEGMNFGTESSTKNLEISSSLPSNAIDSNSLWIDSRNSTNPASSNFQNTATSSSEPQNTKKEKKIKSRIGENQEGFKNQTNKATTLSVTRNNTKIFTSGSQTTAGKSSISQINSAKSTVKSGTSSMTTSTKKPKTTLKSNRTIIFPDTVTEASKVNKKTPKSVNKVSRTSVSSKNASKITKNSTKISQNYSKTTKNFTKSSQRSSTATGSVPKLNMRIENESNSTSRATATPQSSSKLPQGSPPTGSKNMSSISLQNHTKVVKAQESITPSILFPASHNKVGATSTVRPPTKTTTNKKKTTKKKATRKKKTTKASTLKAGTTSTTKTLTTITKAPFTTKPRTQMSSATKPIATTESMTDSTTLISSTTTSTLPLTTAPRFTVPTTAKIKIEVTDTEPSMKITEQTTIPTSKLTESTTIQYERFTSETKTPITSAHEYESISTLPDITATGRFTEGQNLMINSTLNFTIKTIPTVTDELTTLSVNENSSETTSSGPESSSTGIENSSTEYQTSTTERESNSVTDLSSSEPSTTHEISSYAPFTEKTTSFTDDITTESRTFETKGTQHLTEESTVLPTTEEVQTTSSTESFTTTTFRPPFTTTRTVTTPKSTIGTSTQESTTSSTFLFTTPESTTSSTSSSNIPKTSSSSSSTSAVPTTFTSTSSSSTSTTSMPKSSTSTTAAPTTSTSKTSTSTLTSTVPTTSSSTSTIPKTTTSTSTVPATSSTSTSTSSTSTSTSTVPSTSTTPKTSTSTSSSSTSTTTISKTTTKPRTTTKRTTTTTKAPLNAATVNYTAFLPEPKDQGECGSCYIFAALAIVEYDSRAKMMKNHTLSDQDALDCMGGTTNCDGGWPANVLTYVRNSGISDGIKYSYSAVQGNCLRSSNPALRNISNHCFKYLGGDENGLKELVSKGPVAVGVGLTVDMMYYKSGVFYDPTCIANTDHAVTVVGYGTDNSTGKDYWIVRNSWGKNWGMNGYGLFARNQGNHCGIANFGFYLC